MEIKIIVRKILLRFGIRFHQFHCNPKCTYAVGRSRFQNSQRILVDLKIGIIVKKIKPGFRSDVIFSLIIFSNFFGFFFVMICHDLWFFFLKIVLARLTRLIWYFQEVYECLMFRFFWWTLFCQSVLLDQDKLDQDLNIF